MFIVFEGIDGSGTTTQIRLLYEFLEKKKRAVIQTAEPTDGSIGKLIREILSGKKKISPRALQLLFFADREDHLQKTILPALQEKKIVLTDRYFLSSLAYASLSEKTDLFFKIAEYFPVPDLTLFIDVPVEIALDRIGKRGEQKEIFEKKEYLELISRSYRKHVSNIPEEKKLVLNGEMSIQKTFQLIQEKVVEKIREQDTIMPSVL